MGLFKPAWRSNNQEKALQAVAKTMDQNTILQIAADIITVYALDARFDLKDGFPKDALEKAMAGKNSLVSSTISFVIFTILFILSFISIKKDNEQLISDSEALKGLDITNPYFMDWQDIGYKNIGLTVR